MSNRVLIIRHGNDPPDDRVNTYLLLRGFEPVTIRPCAGDPVPMLDETWAGSVVLVSEVSVLPASASRVKRVTPAASACRPE